ncbi:lipoprotein, putative [Minicystis rosea]|nr:lipoprotein, putative [Minicystis rosea]
MKNALAVLAALACLSSTSPSRSGEQDPVTEIRIDKSDHRLELVSQGRVVKTYRVAIGPGGTGHKRMEGDKVTPVGTYRIVGHIKGLFHHFLTVSYPNDEDRTRFADLKKRGELPRDATIGGGIGIHGVNSKAWKGVHKESDWTLGCIALDDDEIDEIAKRVKAGTTVVITD